jgi:hypothetical protein
VLVLQESSAEPQGLGVGRSIACLGIYRRGSCELQNRVYERFDVRGALEE